MKKIYAILAVLMLGMSSMTAQTMTLKIEGKEVKNGDDVTINKQISDMKNVVVPNKLIKYDLHANNVELTSNIAQEILLTGEDLDKDDKNHLACCPTFFSCTTANAENNYISECIMNLSANQVASGEKFIHYAYEDNKDPNPADFVRNCKLTLKGSSETMVVNIKFVVGNPTGVNDVAIDNILNGQTYNLAGQKVNANTKGLVIRNGKKIIND